MFVLGEKMAVENIIESVRRDGDEAIARFTRKFDKVDLRSLEISGKERKNAWRFVSKDTIKAMRFAAKNIETFARAQLKQLKDFEIEIQKGVFVGQKIISIEKIGAYIPAGNYPLVSTVLMTCIPARVAGVKEIIICSPPRYRGTINPVILVAADIVGADRIFKIGGIQAIAAMAYGTKSVPKVDKIVGPGNKYVVAAKKAVYGDVGIDFLAGPTEILVIADENANPKIIAADLLAQKEHDKDAVAVLVTNSKKLAKKVEKIVKKEAKIIVKSIDEAVNFANEFAPEHLSLQVKNPKKYLSRVRNYGSLFLGNNAGVVFGDYVSGPNHVLPTNKCARFASGLSVKDFIKAPTYQYITKKGYNRIKDAAIKLAEIEGLEGHKKSVMVRKWNSNLQKE